MRSALVLAVRLWLSECPPLLSPTSLFMRLSYFDLLGVPLILTNPAHNPPIHVIKHTHTHRIRERNTERLAKQKPVASTQAEKIGYVPRAQQARITASGLTSGGMMRRRPGQEQDLDAESADGLARLQATDAEIDEGISDISSTLDKIARIAGDMREEVTSQTGKLEKIDTMMQKTADKTAVVNARQKYLLR